MGGGGDDRLSGADRQACPSRSCGAVGCSPRSTGCGSWSRSAPSTPGPSPKYFGYKRGITWLNAVNDQVAGIGAKVVPGTPRDSLHILDVLLNLDAGPKPDLIATDEASYSDIVFGIFGLLGYRFSPRLADIGDARYWRAHWPSEPGRRLRPAQRDRPKPSQPGQDQPTLAGHAPRGRFADDPPGSRL